MQVDIFALYAGPDQVMTVTSGVASVVGIFLIFWNKLVGEFFKLLDRARNLFESYVQRDTVTPDNLTVAQKSDRNWA
jgi:hypothetical protein